MKTRAAVVLLCGFALAHRADGGELPVAKPAEVGLSADGLTSLTPALKKLVDDGQVAGGVALVARHGKVAYFEPFGYRDLASKAPMTTDTIFAIASMSKPVTCVAVMTLVEQGKVNLDDPVSKFVPEFAGLRVLGDAKGDTPEGPATVPSDRPVTVRDLMTHTSGFAYGGILSADARLGRAYARAGVMGPGVKTLTEQMSRLAKVPLAHQPGGRWTYGLSHDVLGRVVEVASGQTFDRYLDKHIFKPLDMHDTSFLVPEAKRDRVATIYRSTLLNAPLTPVPRNYGSATLFSGGGGLFSTARDYARFAQMLLSGGELNGTRVLRAESLAAMTSNQIGDLSALVLFKYGLGFGLEMTTKGGKPAVRRFFWGGIFSTNFWVDPGNDLVAVVMTQVLPTNHGGTDRVVRSAVESALKN